MTEDEPEVQLSKIESALIVGIVGCLLLGTWELGHLMADDWFRPWVAVDAFVRRRLILYGLAFLMSSSSVLCTTRFAHRAGRFGRTAQRAFLWYGNLLLLSTIAIFVFDCLPEVLAGYLGAMVFLCAIYIVQRRFHTPERLMKNRLAKGLCFSCGASLLPAWTFCPACATRVGEACPACAGVTRITDLCCPHCGRRRA